MFLPRSASTKPTRPDTKRKSNFTVGLLLKLLLKFRMVIVHRSFHVKLIFDLQLCSIYVSTDL